MTLKSAKFKISKNKVPRSKGELRSFFNRASTDKRVNTEDTLLGFQEFFLQPIKDWPINPFKTF